MHCRREKFIQQIDYHKFDCDNLKSFMCMRSKKIANNIAICQ